MIETILAALAGALATALAKIGEEALKKSVEAGVSPAKELFEAWLHKDYDQARAEKSLRQAVLTALDDLTADLPPGPERLAFVTKLTGKNASVYQLLAAAAVEMVSFDPRLIPARLMEALNLPSSQCELLARFVFALRQRLAKEAGYDKLIAYANDLDVRGRLAGFTHDIARLVESSERAATLLELMTRERKLSENEPQALEDYLDFARRQFAHLALPLISEGAGHIAEPWLKQVFVPLYLRDERAEAAAHQKIDAARQKAEQRQKRRLETTPEEAEPARPVAFQELLARYDCFILIGTPGSGKTTLLRRAALACAENRAAEDLGWQGSPLLPIFVRLRNFGAFLTEHHDQYCEPSAGALVAYLDQQLRWGERTAAPPDFFDRRLGEGHCLVLLDGLDEVTQNRVEVAQQVNAFIRKYRRNGNRFGLSSRPKGYERDTRQQLRDADPALAEVTPLDLAGMRQLIANLLLLLEPDETLRAADLESLPTAITGSPSLLEIAGTPLFCSALVQVYKRHGAKLPERRVDVLDEIVELLLGFWHAQKKDLADPVRLATEDGTERAYRDTQESVDHKRRRLRCLAYYMLEPTRRSELPAQKAKEVLAAYFQREERVKDEEKAWRWAEAFLYTSHERSGLLAESAPGVFTFVHQYFMEFLAAVELVNQDNALQILLARLDDDYDAWGQVILLAGAYQHTMDSLRSRLVQGVLQSAEASNPGSPPWQRRLTLAGLLARDMAGRLAGAQREAVEEALQSAVWNADLAPKTRADLADILDQLWQPPDLYQMMPIENGPAGSPFYIAKYPVTNAQYARFVSAPDFADPELWRNFPRFTEPQKGCQPLKDAGDEGLDWLKRMQKNAERSPDGKRVHPRFWSDPNFGASRRAAPVVGVTWWEANAFCRWLLRRWNDDAGADWRQANPDLSPHALRLPTEAEWIAAAGGAQPEDRFPWDKPGETTRDEAEILRRANVSQSGIERSTPVWLYPLGASPWGVIDLGGNAWEWQANYYDKDHDTLGLRGGSWSYLRDFARLSYRYQDRPGFEWGDLGFRVAALPSLA